MAHFYRRSFKPYATVFGSIAEVVEANFKCHADTKIPQKIQTETRPKDEAPARRISIGLQAIDNPHAPNKARAAVRQRRKRRDPWRQALPLNV